MDEKKSLLDNQVELIRGAKLGRQIDSVDPDLESHVRPYLEKLFSELKAPAIDLTTPESARESLKTLDLTLGQLNTALHRTRSLKSQLEQKPPKPRR